MIIIQNKFSDSIIGHRYTAMCLWPFIFVRPCINLEKQRQILNHELIHARQQLEMLWLFFFIWYGVEYIVRFVLHRSHQQAYRALSHEQEARIFEDNPDYLIKRKTYAWIRFL